MLRKLWAIAWFSAVEVLGHPATLLLTLASAIGTLLLPLFQFQRFSEDGRLARDCGLSTALLFGTLLAIGGAGRLHRALRDGTSAIALVKPLSRGLWFCGNALGTALALGVYLLTQGAATLLAEAYSPRYHAGAAYADVGAIFLAVGVAVGALVLAALNNRVRNGRFALSGSLLLPVALWVLVPFAPAVHWGDLTALVAVAMLLAQATALALALGVRCPPGLTAGVTLAALAVTLTYLGGAAYLPFEPLAGGGTVPARTLLLLVPQACFVTAFLLWCGMGLLDTKETL